VLAISSLHISFLIEPFHGYKMRDVILRFNFRMIAPSHLIHHSFYNEFFKLKTSFLLGPKGVSVVWDMVNLHMFLLSSDFFPICFKNKLMFFDLSILISLACLQLTH
jgi:hypothetical protein